MVKFAPQRLRDVKPWEYLLRFVFGGVITVVTGLIGDAWGPVVAGAFLAFPAILPASLTLVKRHGNRARARDDARGGGIGSVGLIAFAIVVSCAAVALAPPLVLALALAVWLGVSVIAWWVRCR